MSASRCGRYRRLARPLAVVLVVMLAGTGPVGAIEDPQEMHARDVDWAEASPAIFDPQWRLPSLRVPENERKPPERVDLLREMKRIAGLRFDEREGERTLSWTRSFGDVVRGLREAKDDPARRRRMLRILREGRPSVWEQVGAYLPELVHDDRIRGAAWDPDDEEKDDGLLIVEPFDRTAAGTLPWTDCDGTVDVHQGAALIYADLEALKRSENDFLTYPTNVGVVYEYIHAVKGSFIRGRDERGRQRVALRVLFGNDIQFPYGTFDCDLRVQCSLDSDGHLVTDLYSTSEDVYWLAGQSVSIPVFAADGEWVAMLQVLVYGIDLQSVPDGGGSRRAIVRGNLGNLKRRAERRFVRDGGEPRTVSDAIPSFVVRGVGPPPQVDDD